MITRKRSDNPLHVVRKKTVGTVLIVLLICGLISALLILEYGDAEFGGAYTVGALLGVLNGAVGFLTIEKFIDKRTLVFLKGVFLGMGIRLVLLLGVFIILIKLTHVSVPGLVVGLLVFYFTMTVLEVIFLNKRVAVSKSLGGNGA